MNDSASSRAGKGLKQEDILVRSGRCRANKPAEKQHMNKEGSERSREALRK